MRGKKQDDVPAKAGQSGDRQGEQAPSSQSGIHSDFAHASPESNVNAPGRPQSSHGSATEPVPGGPQGGTKGGPSYGQQVVNSSGGAGMDRDS